MQLLPHRESNWSSLQIPKRIKLVRQIIFVYFEQRQTRTRGGGMVQGGTKLSLWICKISQDKRADQPVKKTCHMWARRHVAFVEPPWLETTYVKKKYIYIYMQDVLCSVTENTMQLKCRFCGSDKVDLCTYARVIRTSYTVYVEETLT